MDLQVQYNPCAAGVFFPVRGFSSAWMILLRSRWATRPRGLSAGTGPGLRQQGGGLGVVRVQQG